MPRPWAGGARAGRPRAGAGRTLVWTPWRMTRRAIPAAAAAPGPAAAPRRRAGARGASASPSWALGPELSEQLENLN